MWLKQLKLISVRMLYDVQTHSDWRRRFVSKNLIDSLRKVPRTHEWPYGQAEYGLLGGVAGTLTGALGKAGPPSDRAEPHTRRTI